MTVLEWLVLAVFIYFVNIGVQAVFANLRYSPGTLLGSRDDFAPDGIGLMRARRAQANFTEAMVMFAPLALAAHVTGADPGLASLGGAIFAISRAAYLIVYVAGTPVIRSLVWGAGLIGTGMVGWAVIG
ncbi:MAG: MAPEG family protein [Pseudomonadota bacterium]